jgi:hypothetical protein
MLTTRSQFPLFSMPGFAATLGALTPFTHIVR